VRSSMLHGSETWPVRKENEVALQRAEMKMVRWMCGVKLEDRVPSKELRGRLELDDIISVLQQNRLPEFIPSNSNSGLHSCISISLYTQHVT